MRSGTGEDAVAIVGMACRFPGAADLDAFWRLLCDGRDAVREVPADRWDAEALYDPDPAAPGKMIGRHGAFVDDLDHFDALFFGISPREAHQVDPRQRLVLETGWHALEDAGVPPRRLAGSDTGVFVAHLTGEYEYEVIVRRPRLIDPYAGAGSTDSVLANRLSYSLDLQGPSLSIDTACSGSLVAVHLALRALAAGDCGLALVGGVNALLDPGGNVFFSKAGALSPDGRCRTFDHRANGIVRGEGAGMLVLEPLSRALAAGHRVYALILGSAVNHNGRGNGLMAPSTPRQADLLRRAYREAGVAPAEVQYVEAHGTGTSLGDPVEAAALVEVLGEGRGEALACGLGSVKTNIGHLEAAAGVAGIIKTALAIHHRRLPPTLHFERLNPLISFGGVPLRVLDALTPWPDDAKRLIAGVSGFGLGGANGHVVLAEPPPAAATARPAPVPAAATAERVFLLPLSARSPGALRDLATAYRELLAGEAAPPPGDLCRAASRRRDHHRHRLAVTGRSCGELAAALETVAAAGFDAAPSAAGGRRRLALVFSGQGSQWPRMGLALAERFTVAEAALRSVDAVMRQLGGRPVRADLAAEDGAALATCEGMQAAIFAVQVALADLWADLGVVADAVAGQSLGEAAAAYAAGCLSLEDAARVVHHRSRLMQRSAGSGAAAFVALAGERMQARLRARDGAVCVAGWSTPSSCVVSGAAEGVAEVLAELRREGVFCRLIDNGGVAFHAPLLEPLREELEAALAGLAPRDGERPLFTATAGGAVAGRELDAAYWGRNLCRPFRLDRLVAGLCAAGARTFLEVAPHPVLRRALEGNLDAASVPGRVLASMHRGARDEAPVLDALAGLYAEGWDPAGLYPCDGAWVDLPRYRWQRQRYWYDMLPDYAAAETAATAGRSLGHPLLGTRWSVDDDVVEAVWQRRLGSDDLHWLADHRVQGEPVMPAAGFLEMALAAAAVVQPGTAVRLTGVQLERFLALPAGAAVELQLTLRRDAAAGRRFRVASRPAGEPDAAWTRHAAGGLRCGGETAAEATDLAALRRRCRRRSGGERHYRTLDRLGLQYGASFRVVDAVWAGDDEALVRLVPPATVRGAGGYRLHPAILDGALQALAAVLPADAGSGWVPVAVDELRLDAAVAVDTDELWCHVRRAPGRGEADAMHADVDLLDPSGRPLARLRGVTVARLDASARREAPVGDWLYRVDWVPVAAPAATEPVESEAGTWLLYVDDTAGDALARRLEAAGDAVVRVRPGTAFAARSDGFTVRPGAREDHRRLLAGVLADGASCRGVVHLWSLRVPPLDQLDGTAFDHARELVCAAGVALFQELEALRPAADGGRPVPVWFVTRGAQAVADDDAAEPGQALAWGFARAIGHQEHPRWWGGLVDLDPAEPADAEAAVSALAERLRAPGGAPDGEDLAARRGGAWRAPRLRRAPLPAGRPPAARPLRPDATYLVTGGFAGLAAPVLRWLVERGARRLLLVGRSPLPPREEWAALDPGHPAAGRVGAVRSLEAEGVSVHVETADVADAAALEALLARHADEGWPPVRGVVHLAGVVRDRLVVEAGDADIAPVLDPKARGALNLHRALAGAELDELVLFSSLAAWLSPPGQSVYAAANAFLDALAQHRRRRGQAASSLGWGPWAERGMVARLGLAERLERLGARPLAPDDGLAVLRAVAVGEAPVHRLVLHADWTALAQGFFAAAPPPFLADLVQAAPAAGGRPARPEGGDLRAALALAGDPAQRLEKVTGSLRELVAGVLRLGPQGIDPTVPLLELGMDSIVAMELKTWVEGQLGVSIPMTDWLRGPSLEELARRIEPQVMVDAAAAGLGNAAAPAAGAGR